MIDGCEAMTTEPCEWNPKHRMESVEPPGDGDCPNEATICLGRYGEWHVCEACAALPEFKRFKVRRRLIRAQVVKP